MQLLQLLVLVAPAAAGVVKNVNQACFTSFGSKSIKRVPTSTKTLVRTYTHISTKTTKATTTVTPTITVSADTVLIITTTLPQKTDTATALYITTTTTTATLQASETDTITDTMTSSVQSTVTASTAANFTPFASLAAVIAAGGGTPQQPMAKEKRENSRAAPRSVYKNKKGKQYPEAVTCVKYVDKFVIVVKTVAAPKTKTKTASASIFTSYDTLTVTSTVVPDDASTTVTDTVTSTVLSVTVSTSTSLVTSYTTTTTYYGPAATYYPQCQDNNLIAYVGGQPLYYISSTSYTSATTPDAVTCCQLCANTPDCAGFSGPENGYTDCYLLLDQGTCDASQTYWTVYGSTGTGNGDFDVVGNGNCGQGTYAAQQ